MRNIWVIAKREYNHYFASPTAYVVGFIMLFILGIYFFVILLATNQQALFGGGGSAPDVTPFTWLFVFLALFLTPALTMHLLSDEAESGTLELLLTAPVRDAELVIGKWLGAMLFMLTLLGLTIIYPLILQNLVSPGIDQKMMISAYLGVILVVATLLAIGVGVSASFKNRFAAMGVTFVIFFFLWFMVAIPANYIPNGGDVLRYLSLPSHFSDTMNRGSIELGDIVYFVSLTALGLFIGTRAVEMRRWR